MFKRLQRAVQDARSPLSKELRAKYEAHLGWMGNPLDEVAQTPTEFIAFATDERTAPPRSAIQMRELVRIESTAQSVGDHKTLEQLNRARGILKSARALCHAFLDAPDADRPILAKRITDQYENAWQLVNSTTASVAQAVAETGPVPNQHVRHSDTSLSQRDDLLEMAMKLYERALDLRRQSHDVASTTTAQSLANQASELEEKARQLRQAAAALR